MPGDLGFCLHALLAWLPGNLWLAAGLDEAFLVLIQPGLSSVLTIFQAHRPQQQRAKADQEKQNDSQGLLKAERSAAEPQPGALL